VILWGCGAAVVTAAASRCALDGQMSNILVAPIFRSRAVDSPISFNEIHYHIEIQYDR